MSGPPVLAAGRPLGGGARGWPDKTSNVTSTARPRDAQLRADVAQPAGRRGHRVGPAGTGHAALSTTGRRDASSCRTPGCSPWSRAARAAGDNAGSVGEALAGLAGGVPAQMSPPREDIPLTGMSLECGFAHGHAGRRDRAAPAGRHHRQHGGRAAGRGHALDPDAVVSPAWNQATEGGTCAWANEVARSSDQADQGPGRSRGPAGWPAATRWCRAGKAASRPRHAIWTQNGRVRASISGRQQRPLPTRGGTAGTNDEKAREGESDERTVSNGSTWDKWPSARPTVTVDHSATVYRTAVRRRHLEGLRGTQYASCRTRPASPSDSGGEKGPRRPRARSLAG